MGTLIPPVYRTYDLAETAEAARLVQRNDHVGKVVVRCLAPEPELGVTDPVGRSPIRPGIDRWRAATRDLQFGHGDRTRQS